MTKTKRNATKRAKAESTITIPAADLAVLKERGFVPGNPDTVPDNVGPKVKAALLAMDAED